MFVLRYNKESTHKLLVCNQFSVFSYECFWQVQYWACSDTILSIKACFREWKLVFFLLYPLYKENSCLETHNSVCSIKIMQKNYFIGLIHWHAVLSYLKLGNKLEDSITQRQALASKTNAFHTAAISELWNAQRSSFVPHLFKDSHISVSCCKCHGKWDTPKVRKNLIPGLSLTNATM